MVAQTETFSFTLAPHSRFRESIMVQYRLQEGVAELTIKEGDRCLLSERVYAPIATTLHAASKMEAQAQGAKGRGELLQALGYDHIARFARTHVARSLRIPELAQYD